MGDAIGQMLPFAVGVAISPMPIVAVVLMLVTPRAWSNGPAFVLGWVLGLAVVGGIVLAVAGPTDASDDGAPAAWVDWLKLVLGLGLVLIAVKQWRARPHDPADVKTPKWMSAIDSFTPAKALGIAFLLSAINPKNLLLLVGGAAAIAQTGIPGGEQAVVALALFIVIATIGVGTPVVIFFVMGDRAAGVLDRLKNWMAANNVAIMPSCASSSASS